VKTIFGTAVLPCHKRWPITADRRDEALIQLLRAHVRILARLSGDATRESRCKLAWMTVRRVELEVVERRRGQTILWLHGEEGLDLWRRRFSDG